jgi:transcriptional regulator with XRE-family HTH domain
MDEDFSKRLYNLTVHRGLTQSRLALLADMPATSVHALITGQRQPAQSEINRLAKALNVEPNDLSTDEH